MQEDLTNTAGYKTLVTEIKNLLERSHVTGSKALTAQKLDAYWRAGKKLHQTRRRSNAFLKQLAEDVDAPYVDLQRYHQFYETWEGKLPDNVTHLSWTHHLLLMTIGDKKARDFYIKHTIENGLNREALRRAIKDNLIDKVKEVDKTKPTKPTTPLQIEPTNVYPAEVKTIIDGDTIDVRIDLGFDTWSKKRLRLKGINCAELPPRRGGVTPPDGSPAGGDAAKQVVIEKLSPCKAILIKTHKTDLYDRYLTDIYYHAAYSKKEDLLKHGIHLNQELLDLGLAKPMMG